MILAGLMEVAFTFSLGKTKTTIGAEQIWWYAGFLVALSSVCFLCPRPRKKYLLELFILFGPELMLLVQYLWAYYFNEPATFWRVFFITTLIISIIVLKVLA